MFEENYQRIMFRFLRHQSTVNEFVEEFMTRWKLDRDAPVQDEKFRDMIDRLFTSCDCYRPSPLEAWEISEEELRAEVKKLSPAW